MDRTSPVSVKAEISIKTEIPATSTGRLVDSLTDIIRPLTEAFGWVGDLVAERRRRALDVVEKASARILQEERPHIPVPPKILVPLLERASLEEEGDPLIDRWANLLASAAMYPEKTHPRYAQILSEITYREASILRSVARNGFKSSKDPSYDLYYKANRSQSSKFEAEFKEFLGTLPNDRCTVIHRCLDYFQVPGVYPIDVLRHWHDDKETDPLLYFRDYVSDLIMDIEGEQAIDVLVSLGLMHRGRVIVTSNSYHIDARYICISYLGADFIVQCESDLFAD
jgi:hypothetical protein